MRITAKIVSRIYRRIPWRARFEARLWLRAFLRQLPGFIGCAVRNLLIPYENGVHVTVWEHVQIDCPERLRMGDFVSINRYSIINAAGGITIGDHVMTGPRVTLYSQNHRFSDQAKLISEQGYALLPVRIGNNVWLAANVIVLPGVTIGDDVVAAAGAVITKDVESGSLVAGNPAKVIRRIRPDESGGDPGAQDGLRDDHGTSFSVAT
jgi:acetyltransferase-like isoleucine patch superfamily enzyme